MFIRKLEIKNYKSLRNVSVLPSAFTVVIGPNGSGKSNLASSLDFLSDVYQNGIEFAIAKKGGFENIAYRKIRRTKAAIEFTIEAELNSAATKRVLMQHAFRKLRTAFPSSWTRLSIRHHFSLRASQTSIGADYRIESERLDIFPPIGSKSKDRRDRIAQEEVEPLVSLYLDGNRLAVEGETVGPKEAFEEVIRFFEFFSGADGDFDIFLRKLFPAIATAIGGIAVHQFSPQISRSPGSPSPQPKLSGYGQNLPSLVDWLQRHHKTAWQSVESAMRDILPDLEGITVDYLHTKQLGLFFKEKNFGRAWAAEDVSDGTIQTLAILTALADPRNTLLFLEEPENSVHPWIVRQLASHIKQLSKRSQIIVTTHSPLILNVVHPESVVICYKEHGETHLDSLTQMAPELVRDWEGGVDRLFELLDTGCVERAVPLGRASE